MKSVMRSAAVSFSVLMALAATPGRSQDYSVAPLDSPVPAEGLSPAIAEQLASTGIQVRRGGDRVVCEIWLLKTWELKAFAPQGDLLYPFTPGQLIGVVRLPRKTGDFRDQGVAKGLYTLRYALQPVDGNHVGTSPTRDFLLLTKVEADPSPEVLKYEPLTKASAEAAGTAHPAMWALKAVVPGADNLRHDDTNDWWLVRLEGKGRVGTDVKDLAVDLVVIGHAVE